MPVRSGRLLARRALALGALATAAIAAVAWLVSAAGGDYGVTATFDNAGQLVGGNEVKVGSIVAGTVEEIRLDGRNRAEIEMRIRDGFVPLHRGTRATVRSTSLAGIANRYVSLTPGPNNAAEIPDGGRIVSEDTIAAVDLDQVLNALTPATTDALRDVTRAGATSFRGRGPDLDRGLEALSPALSATSDLLAELVRDQRSLERLVAGTADVVTTLAERRDDLASGTAAAATATRAIASEREALAETLRLLPGTLRQGNTTLVNLRAALGDVRPAIPEARPVARGLSRLLPILTPVAATLRREIPAARALIRRRGRGNDLLDLLAALPGLERAGKPVVRDLVSVLDEALPVLDDVRPYVPDLTSGLFAGFGGNAAGYYDANGQYARISLIGGPFSANNAGSLLPRPPAEFGTGFKSGQVRRCPGSAVYPAPDGSNPYTANGTLDCDPAVGGGAP